MENKTLTPEVTKYLTHVDTDNQIAHLTLMAKRLKRLDCYSNLTIPQKNLLKNLEKTIDDYMSYSNEQEKQS